MEHIVTMRLRNRVHRLRLVLFSGIAVAPLPGCCARFFADRRNQSAEFHRDHFTVSAGGIHCLLRCGPPRHEDRSLIALRYGMSIVNAGSK